jgi:hypothetical protein
MIDKRKNESKEGLLIQQVVVSDISVQEAYGTLTILPGDPELSHVRPRFSGARGAYRSCSQSHTR